MMDEYDVVSMHQYLEHTREPLEELKAANRVLKVGGYLLIEVPNPDSLLGVVLRSFWLAWFQPQHLHFRPDIRWKSWWRFERPR